MPHETEDIPLFVAGIANDIASDIVTRIVFEPLVDVTNACVAMYP